jgi:hypothetical protein
VDGHIVVANGDLTQLTVDALAHSTSTGLRADVGPPLLARTPASSPPSPAIRILPGAVVGEGGDG